MAIYDCFQYFNEDHMVDLRINILNNHVDFFVISESTKTHQGDNKKLIFNIAHHTLCARGITSNLIADRHAGRADHFRFVLWHGDEHRENCG